MDAFLCGSLSLHPVELGQAMHEAGYRALGLPGRYVPFAAREDRLEPALAAIRALGVRGIGVSMPFKLAVLPLLDELSPQAQQIGAVNTIVNADGRLVGHNTDAEGAARALEERVSLAGRRVLVVGAGGAARAVLVGLAERGAELALVNRTESRARALAEQLPGIELRVAPLERPGMQHELVVNASAAGMAGYGELPLTDAALAGRLVMDIVYKPLATDLLRRAAALGCDTIHGGRMLLHQAAAQFSLYTGRPAPLAAMDAALRRFVR